MEQQLKDLRYLFKNSAGMSKDEKEIAERYLVEIEEQVSSVRKEALDGYTFEKDFLNQRITHLSKANRELKQELVYHKSMLERQLQESSE